jgi:hypothetical protein
MITPSVRKIDLSDMVNLQVNLVQFDDLKPDSREQTKSVN